MDCIIRLNNNGIGIIENQFTLEGVYFRVYNTTDMGVIVEVEAYGDTLTECVRNLECAVNTFCEKCFSPTLNISWDYSGFYNNDCELIATLRTNLRINF